MAKIKELCWECTGSGNGVGILYCKICKGTGYIDRDIPDDKLTANQKKILLQSRLNEIDAEWNDLKVLIGNGKISMMFIPDKLYKISEKIRKQADYIVTDILKIKGAP